MSESRRVGGQMALKHRTITRVETHSVTVVRAAQNSIELWCEACDANTSMVTPERAAEMLETNPRVIYRRVESGDFHFIETSVGELLICCHSLSRGGESKRMIKRADD